MSIYFEQVTIVGVGLIGGSLGMALKRDGLADRVVGLGRSLSNLELAVKIGAIDRYEQEPAPALKGTDLVIVATPVESYQAHFQKWGKLLQSDTIVSDVGSVKGLLVEQAEHLLPPHVRFVGAHPIAGKEKSGVIAGDPDLFRGATCIVTPTSKTDADALAAIQDLWKTVGSKIVMLDPFLHDWIFGAVSHLPHIAAFALMNALSDIENNTQDEVDLLAFAGGGLRDTTRIAASSPEMWRDICLWNRDNLLKLIDMYEKHLQQYKELLKAQDPHGLENMMIQARESRNRIT